MDLTEFVDKKVMYIGRTETLDGRMVDVKIGYTNDIMEVVAKSPRMALVKVLECYNNDDFVEFLHGHKDIKPSKIKYSRGVFRMTEEDLELLVNKATRNVVQFRLYDTQSDYERDFHKALESHPTIIKLGEKLRALEERVL